MKYYRYNELSDSAKEKVKQWYLYDDFRVDEFTNMVEIDLEMDFPNSDLNVQYSLSYSQGDGLNIYGDLSLKDALKISTVSDDIKRKIEDAYESYLKYDGGGYNKYGGLDISLSENYRYGYSMKFIDIKNVNDYFDTFESYYDKYEDENFDSYFAENVIKPFLINVLEYMEELDKKYEEMGYKFFYEVDDEEIEDACESNGWVFDEDGDFAGYA